MGSEENDPFQTPLCSVGALPSPGQHGQAGAYIFPTPKLERPFPEKKEEDRRWVFIAKELLGPEDDQKLPLAFAARPGGGEGAGCLLRQKCTPSLTGGAQNRFPIKGPTLLPRAQASAAPDGAGGPRVSWV